MVHFVFYHWLSGLKGMHIGNIYYAGHKEGGGIHRVYLNSTLALTGGNAS